MASPPICAEQYCKAACQIKYTKHINPGTADCAPTEKHHYGGDIVPTPLFSRIKPNRSQELQGCFLSFFSKLRALLKMHLV
jgi:hypothetical protein